MKSKIIFLLLTIFLLGGCSIEYDLTIDGNKYNEEVLIHALEDENNSKSTIYAEYLNEYSIFIDEEFQYYNPTNKNEKYTYYTKDIEELNNGYNLRYKANYTNDNFERARSLNTIFQNVEFIYLKKEKCYYLTLKNCTIFNYNQDIDSLTANVTLKNIEVVDNNADNIQLNTYTWNINKDTEIKIKYRLNKEKDEDSEIVSNKEDDSQNYSYLVIAIGVILSFILVVFIVSNVYFKKAQK